MLSKKEILFISLLWLAATLANINKAFHIDDTFHLEAAQWIKEHPTTPMSGKINWSESPSSISHFNQPPLYFFMLAGVGGLFGFSEIPLHLFQSIFTFIAILYFYKLAKLYTPKHSLWLTSFFILSPAFIVNQNLMVDIPILALILSFIYILISPNFKSETLRHTIAALILSSAILIKYSVLPLSTVFLYSLIYRKNTKAYFTLCIPITIFLMFFIWNIWEFGEIHMFNRPKKELLFSTIIVRAKEFAICLGAISPFTIAFYNGFSKIKSLAIITSLGFLLFTILSFSGIINLYHANKLLYFYFIINGFLFIGLALFSTFSSSKKWWPKDYTTTILILWLATIGSFLLLFAPFSASRHLLLLIPPLLLLSSKYLLNISVSQKIATLTFSICITMAISTSDWIYANFFRKNSTWRSPKITDKTAPIYALGHWGWQWYSIQSGMKTYNKNALYNNGDYFITAENISSQHFNTNDKFILLDSLVHKSNPYLEYFNVETASMYANKFPNVMPWKFSTSTNNKLYLYKKVGIQKL